MHVVLFFRGIFSRIVAWKNSATRVETTKLVTAIQERYKIETYFQWKTNKKSCGLSNGTSVSDLE